MAMKINKSSIDFSWQDESACKGVSTELFFPTTMGAVQKELIELCDSCPVYEECLSHALHHEHYGIWAGTSEKQRISIRRNMNIDCHKPEALYWIGTREEHNRTEANRTKIKGRGRKSYRVVEE